MKRPIIFLNNGIFFDIVVGQMNIVEGLLNIIALPDCGLCGAAAAALCEGCQNSICDDQVSVCYRCNAHSPSGQTCKTCRRTSRLQAVWNVGFYEAELKLLISNFKFDSQRHYAGPLAQMLIERVPYSVLQEKPAIVPLPTASHRVRQRGFDQACLLAQEFARQSKLEYQPWLRRIAGDRQLGASRQQRQVQALKQFGVYPSRVVKGSTVILVDDVMTTGATLEAAARVLKSSGVKRVYAVVLARDK
jgi:ComF family protein